MKIDFNNKYVKIGLAIVLPTVVVLGYMGYKKFILKEPIFKKDDNASADGGYKAEQPTESQKKSMVNKLLNATGMSRKDIDMIKEAKIEQTMEKGVVKTM